MRYSKEHKAETHQRIVTKAAVKLREKGLHGVGVADLMKDAGLTHGGFYAHFDSRETLVIEAFSRAMDASVRNWRKLMETTPPQRRLQSLVENYLSCQHRDGPGHGCAVPTLGGDIVRESPKTRRAFAAKIEELLALIAETMPDLPPKVARQQALGAMSTMIGALVLSRIVGPESSDEVLKAGQQAVLGAPSAAKSKPAAKPKT
jgi:TetR/AcrR family transcriptional repressor of nem operon